MYLSSSRSKPSRSFSSGRSAYRHPSLLGPLRAESCDYAAELAQSNHNKDGATNLKLCPQIIIMARGKRAWPNIMLCAFKLLKRTHACQVVVTHVLVVQPAARIRPLSMCSQACQAPTTLDHQCHMQCTVQLQLWTPGRTFSFLEGALHSCNCALYQGREAGKVVQPISRWRLLTHLSAPMSSSNSLRVSSMLTQRPAAKDYVIGDTQECIRWPLHLLGHA